MYGKFPWAKPGRGVCLFFVHVPLARTHSHDHTKQGPGKCSPYVCPGSLRIRVVTDWQCLPQIPPCLALIKISPLTLIVYTEGSLVYFNFNKIFKNCIFVNI